MCQVLRFSAEYQQAMHSLLQRFQLTLIRVENNQPILGSFWGDEEAGLLGNKLYARDDTPLHSILHESCHFICMDETRRTSLDTNAGGSYDEENAVCYLQILLADLIPGFGRSRMWQDMDSWGYSFRLGSAKNWFLRDADDARDWLLTRNLIKQNNQITFELG